MKNKINNLKYIFLILFILSLCPACIIHAHPGRTDSAGGHYDSSTGEYHYHHGYPAHQHKNGICPYDSKNSVENSSQSTPSNTSSVKGNTMGNTINYSNINYLSQFDFAYMALLLIPPIAIIILLCKKNLVTQLPYVFLPPVAILVIIFLFTYEYRAKVYHYFWIVLIPLISFVILYIKYYVYTKESALSDQLVQKEAECEELYLEIEALKNQIHQSTLNDDTESSHSEMKSKD